MSKTLKITLVVTGTLVAGSILILAGIIIGRSFEAPFAYWPGDRMVRFTSSDGSAGTDFPTNQYSYAMGTGMMGNYARTVYINQDGPEAEPDDYDYSYGMGPSMMGGRYGHGFGMMDGFYPGAFSDVEPLSLEQAQTAVEAYLVDLNAENLILGEIMIFENHAYAQILEKETSIGAMEVLVDPVTLAVYPEHGPNMMWNLRYGMMSAWGDHAHGMMGGHGFRGGWYDPAPEVSADMPLNSEQAVKAAQRYLDAYHPGLIADDHADQFYGYYTLHILEDGEVAGMLSVNGYTQQVFLHTWHGDFIEMSSQ